jgi:hypothetical protein
MDWSTAATLAIAAVVIALVVVIGIWWGRNPPSDK